MHTHKSLTSSGFVSLKHTCAYANTPTHIMFHTRTDTFHTHTQTWQKALPLCLGGPGSGKGTQCLKIAERYSFQYVSVGELLRKKMIHNATSNRKWSLIAKIITNGELAPQVAEKQSGGDGGMCMWVKQGEYERKDERQIWPVTRRSLSQRECNKAPISSIQSTSMLERRMLIRLISILFCTIMKKMGTDPLWPFVFHSLKHCIEKL